MLYGKQGKRAFNIKFGEKVIIEKLDVAAKVGPYVPYDEYIEFELKDGQILYEDEPCANAFQLNSQKLVINFEKIDKFFPMVSGIILYGDSLKGISFEKLKKFYLFFFKKNSIFKML